MENIPKFTKSFLRRNKPIFIVDEIYTLIKGTVPTTH